MSLAALAIVKLSVFRTGMFDNAGITERNKLVNQFREYRYICNFIKLFQ